MNKRIKQLAEQAFMVCLKGADEKHLEQLERFAELVRQDEREACAEIARFARMHSIADAIMKRGRNMSTKPENIDTSAERVHETDKSVHEPWDTSDMAHRSGGLSVEDDDIQEYNDKETVMNYDDIKIVFTLKQIHFILDSLGKMPYSQTAALYENIQKITAEQMLNPNNTNL